MKRARTTGGLVVLTLDHKVSHAMALPLAKSVRDELSEAIFECEGGDPSEWKEITYERRTKKGTARVWESGKVWRVRVWLKNDSAIINGSHPTKQQAFAAADEVLG